MPLLEIRELTAGYGDVDVLHGVSLSVGEGEIVSLVGANGAGKTTLLRAISGVVRSHGYVGFLGSTISGLSSHEIVSRGIAHVPEGRQLFADMTVLENLSVGAPRGLPRQEMARRLDETWSMFPRFGGTAKPVRGNTVGRGAANGGHRPGADAASETSDAG